MAKHRAVIVGAGRIGAGYKWDQDLGYTHAGAYLALKDRVDLVGFVEPEKDRREEATRKWGVPSFEHSTTAILQTKPDIVSICVHPEQQSLSLQGVINMASELSGLWVEKPWVSGDLSGIPVQVNYQRRADYQHQRIAMHSDSRYESLIVYGKDDETTRCHFRDLSRFWRVPLVYRPFQGPCAYILNRGGTAATSWFDNGGVDSAECFKGMLGNLLDAVEGKAELWSPPYVENA